MAISADDQQSLTATPTQDQHRQTDRRGTNIRTRREQTRREGTKPMIGKLQHVERQFQSLYSEITVSLEIPYSVLNL